MQRLRGRAVQCSGVGRVEVGEAVEGGILVLGDGRRPGYAQYGQADGEPLFYFHGHPGSRLEARFADQAAAAADLRVIALDRPGYGLSDLQPGQALVGWPADVAEAADLLQIDRFSVAGASGGGPYALACAWRLPGRVTRAAVISGVARTRFPASPGGCAGRTGSASRGAHGGQSWPGP